MDMVPITVAVYTAALAYKAKFRMSPQDAIIYASIISDLRQRGSTEEKCFVSRNWKDFEDQEIDAELKAFNCRYVSTFADTVQFVKRLSPRHSE